MDKAERRGYNKGYRAGKKAAPPPDPAVEAHKERVYLACLDLALKHGSGWKVDGKEMNSGDMYTLLARRWAERALREMRAL